MECVKKEMGFHEGVKAAIKHTVSFEIIPHSDTFIVFGLIYGFE